MRFVFNEDQILRLKKRLSKENINEDFLDDLIAKAPSYLEKGVKAAQDFISGLDSNVDVTKKSQDIASKADFIGDNVDDFYKILEDIKEPIRQQKYGSMKHQQSVEAVQISLQILGYSLPKFGTDGLFGPETAIAVNKYKQDKNIQDADDTEENTYQTSLQEMVMEPPLPIESGKSYRWNEKRSYETHQGIDIPAKVGTPIKAIADGKVIGAGNLGSMCGDGISIEHADGFKSGYCHLSGIKVNKGDIVKVGDIIGLSGGAKNAAGSGNSSGPHLHLTLKKDGQKVNPLEFFGTSIGSYYDDGGSGIQVGGAQITPEMVKQLIDDLKSKNITSEDIKKHIDPAVTTGGALEFTDLDLNTQNGVDAYKDICDNYIKQRNPNAFVTGAMMADAAKRAFQRYRKYIPPELALSQLTLEGGISKDTNTRPIRTKNPFNVGNTPTKSNPQASFEDGVNLYYDLIARRYLVNGKTAKDLINDFKNDQGSAYADVGYEAKLRSLVTDIRRKNEPVYASLKSKQQATLAEELITEADKRAVIKNTFGLNQDWADEFHRLSDKLSIWIADTFLKEMIERYGDQAPAGDDKKEFIINMLNDNLTPVSNLWTNNYKSKYEYILHWIRAPRREQLNIRELSLDQAYAMAQEWHDTLQANKESNYKEEGDVFIDYRNAEGVGYYWVHLHKNYCSSEADRMGHCARSNRGELISFRKINDFGEGESYLTVDYRPGGVIGDFHRHGNNKPTARFHKQIVDFLINTTYPVTQLTRSGVHRYEDNFQLSDLSPENLKRVMDGNQNLKYNIDDETSWPLIIDALISNELNLSQYGAETKLKLLKKAFEISKDKGEEFKGKFTEEIITDILRNMDRINTSDMRFFMSLFAANVSTIISARLEVIDGKFDIEDFTDALKDISNRFFDYYQYFCELIDRGFRMYTEEEKIQILATKGIKRTILSCSDAVPFLARYVENSPVDKNGNIAVKTEEKLWGLLNQNGETILHPQFQGISLNVMDPSGKTYLVRNLQDAFFKYNYETGEYTKFSMKR